MDNLITHRVPIITQMIITAGHRIVYRAHYYPVDVTIEYVFNNSNNNNNNKLIDN
jgi:transposase